MSQGPRRVGLVGGVGILVVLCGGLAYSLASPGDLLESSLLRRMPLGLNTEFSIPAVFSAILLLSAAALAHLASRAYPPRPSVALRLVSALFAFMGIDELLVIHEGLENLTNQSWQTLYAPLVVLGGIAWLISLAQLRTVPLAPWSFVAGAAAWVVSQVFELQQYDDEVLVARWMVLPEEALEMVGSLLFVLALLLGVQAWVARSESDV
jgi:hypothetical protein